MKKISLKLLFILLFLVTQKSVKSMQHQGSSSKHIKTFHDKSFLARHMDFWNAIEAGSLDQVKEILGDITININLRHILDSSPPLVQALINEQYDIADLFLGIPDIDFNAPDIYDTTPLMHAIIKGNSIIINKLLLRYDIALKAVDRNGMTALIHAARLGKVDVVKELLKRDGSFNLLNIKDFYNHDALYWAEKEKHHEVVKVLKEFKKLRKS